MNNLIVFLYRSLSLAGLYVMVSIFIFKEDASISTLIQGLIVGSALTLLAKKFIKFPNQKPLKK